MASPTSKCFRNILRIRAACENSWIPQTVWNCKSLQRRMSVPGTICDKWVSTCHLMFLFWECQTENIMTLCKTTVGSVAHVFDTLSFDRDFLCGPDFHLLQTQISVSHV